MSHKKVRANKTCQNCGYFVAERFCPHCGQENIETRGPFYLLFAHFITDFLHYDNQFWRTIAHLYRPAKLPQAYLSGKRKSYVSPFKLYIFISFLVFFIPAILPDMDTTHNKDEDQNHEASTEIATENTGHKNKVVEVNVGDAEDEDFPEIVRKLLRKLQTLDNDKVDETFIHYAPKAIFLYLPVFAFWLWIFHSKKKWLYFDHGIYTLCYFSFLLLTILSYIIVDWLFSIVQLSLPSWIKPALFGYFIYYFFHSHRMMYRESKALSRTKCVLLVAINSICMLVFILLYFVAIVLFFS